VLQSGKIESLREDNSADATGKPELPLRSELVYKLPPEFKIH